MERGAAPAPAAEVQTVVGEQTIVVFAEAGARATHDCRRVKRARIVADANDASLGELLE